jgi:RNA-directed DNA polymerase
VDADIRGAFDNICGEFLLKAIGGFPGREQIKQWLKAGYVEYGTLHRTTKGVPQGSVIGPLMCNIALHGMESALEIKYDNWGTNRSKRALVKYADDLVVFCESREDAEEVIQILNNWLKDRGLELSSEKTKICHLSEGFDFLGFNIRHYRSRNARTGWKLLIKPSKKSVQDIKDKMREIWLRRKGQEMAVILRELNPIIRGWANYYRIGVASRTFRKLDSWMFRRQVRYVNRKHPNKPKYWKRSRYWRKLIPGRQGNWVFGDKRRDIHLLKFSWFPIERHVLVRGKASPDDSTLQEYWGKRNMARSKNLTAGRRRIAKAQSGICPVCGGSLFNGEQIHAHHKKPIKEGGKDISSNLQLLHVYCHQQVHSRHIKVTA